MRHRRGFTLIEILVVVGMLAVLAGILLPSINRAREQATITGCAANLRAAGQSLINYAVQNNDRLPVFPGAGAWLWDLPVETRNALVKHGTARNSMYCPGFDEQNVDKLWDFDPEEDGVVNFSVTGYFWLIQRSGGTYPPIDERVTAADPKKKGYQSKVAATIKGRRSDEIELVTDANLSQDGRFMEVKGDYTYTHDVPHPDSRDKPRGGNIVFMDGHVEWRLFNDMKIRATDPKSDVDFWF